MDEEDDIFNMMVHPLKDKGNTVSEDSEKRKSRKKMYQDETAKERAL